MKFVKLQELAHGLSEDEAQATLRQLVSDPRFAAVVKLIEDQKTHAADASAQLKFAEHHGCLAHAAGVRHGLLELEACLRAVCDPPKKRGLQLPPES